MQSFSQVPLTLFLEAPVAQAWLSDQHHPRCSHICGGGTGRMLCQLCMSSAWSLCCSLVCGQTCFGHSSSESQRPATRIRLRTVRERAGHTVATSCMESGAHTWELTGRGTWCSGGALLPEMIEAPVAASSPPSPAHGPESYRDPGWWSEHSVRSGLLTLACPPHAPSPCSTQVPTLTHSVIP